MSTIYRDETTRNISRAYDFKLQQFMRENNPCRADCERRKVGCKKSCKDHDTYQQDLAAFKEEITRTKRNANAFLSVRYEHKRNGR